PQEGNIINNFHTNKKQAPQEGNIPRKQNTIINPVQIKTAPQEGNIITTSIPTKTNSAGGKYSAEAKYYYQSCSDKNSSAGGKYY
ncbi:MAG: hypothetical protein M3R17_15085, partial [Bacteroidota bacterium]|nr:hypothetical protein [Bacteroidota bacterium]